MKFTIHNFQFSNNFKILNLKLRINFAVLLTVGLLSFITTSKVYAQTIDPTLWQTGATGLRTSSNVDQKTAGLTAVIKASGVPFISLPSVVADAGWSRISGPVSLELGEIKIPGINTYSLSAESADWAHNEMNFTNNLKILVSRLSPAVLVQNTNLTNSLRLFSGNLNGATMGLDPWSAHDPYVYTRTPAPAYPKWIAYSSGGSIRVQAIPSSGATPLTLPVLVDNWILVWYGDNSYFVDTKTPVSTSYIPHSDAYQADAPILIKFENNPISIRQSSEGGIDLDFGVGVNSGYTSLMPLFGRNHPRSSDTESWGTSGNLPSSGTYNVISKLNFWASNNRLCSYPTQVKEGYTYDNASDIATISEEITYLNVCPGGSSTSGFAILPPVIALAKDVLGTNFSTSSILVNASYPTEFGPIQGVDNTNTYSWSVSGLKKYTDNDMVPPANPGTAPGDLVQMLTGEIDKLTQVGHFKPWMFSDETPTLDFHGDIYFLNPADIIYHLSEVAHTLPDSQTKSNLIDYIKSERNNPNYNPETVYNLPDEGTLRASQALNNYARFQSAGAADIFLKRVPLYSFYALAKYYDLTTETIPTSVISSAKTALQNDSLEQDWATYSWFRGFGTKHTAVENTNRYLAGMIGFTKLAQASQDIQMETLGRGLLAKTTLARLAMAKFPRYLYSAGILTLPPNPDWMPRYTAGTWGGVIWNYNWSTPNDDANQVAFMDQYGSYLYDSTGFNTPGVAWDSDWMFYASSHLSAYSSVVPEVFRLLTDYAKQDTEIYMNKYTTFLPHWYMPNSEAVLGLEHNVNHPGDSFQIFMAKAFVQKDTPENLARYASVPWLTDGSDFFYLHKLAETIKAYQGWVWEDELAGATPTTVPTACALTGGSWSSVGPMVEGTLVNLNINTSGDCNGKNIEIKVFDDDGSIALNDEIVTLPQVTAYGSTVTASWTTVYTPDSDDLADLLGDRLPEYFFEARVVGESGFTNSPYNSELVVTQLPVGEPIPTPTPIESGPTGIISPTTLPTSTPSATLTPPVGGGECGLETASALWSTTISPENTSVTLTVKGNGSACIGQSVEFNIRRNIDIGFDEDITKLTANFNDTLEATTSWTTPNWFDSCGGIDPRVCDPIYHFDALTGTNSQRSNDLTVTDYTPTASTDWPQVAKDPQHTGYSNETLGTNFKVSWTYNFAPDRVYPQAQAIIYQGKAFVTTEGANGQKPTLYALDAVNPDPSFPGDQWTPGRGRVIWKFEAGGPILASAAAENGLTYISSMDGAIYAVDANNGNLRWKKQLLVDRGFSTAPVIAENKILIGGQDGNFYALNPADGTVVWQYEVGYPIFMTAAYNNGKVYFGAHDMFVYALNTSDGTLAWKSSDAQGNPTKLKGIAMKDYWPLVTQGKVFIRPWADYGDGGPKGPTFYALDEQTGVIDTSYPQNDNQTMDGATTPPCVDREGKLVIPAGAIGETWESGWGRLDLATNTVETISRIGGTGAGGWGNLDENLNVSCSQNLILTFHTQETNANFTGFYNLDNQTWISTRSEPIGNQMKENTQGAGGNPPSISNGMVYHITWHQLRVRTTQ